MAAFQEVFRRSGVDERRSPPGMVVPLGDDNIVALIDPGRKLKVEPIAGLEIKEIDGAEIRSRDPYTRNASQKHLLRTRYRFAAQGGVTSRHLYWRCTVFQNQGPG